MEMGMSNADLLTRPEAAENRERPILFAGPMVRAILDGRKTVTRRIVRRTPGICDACWSSALPHNDPAGAAAAIFGSASYLRVGACEHGAEEVMGERIRCPQGVPGDRLWVRETHAVCVGEHLDASQIGGVRYSDDARLDPTNNVVYRAHNFNSSAGNSGVDRLGAPRFVPQWKPSIFMPRWACRITLEVTDVRVERLQEITDEDARLEGVTHGSPVREPIAARSSFAMLWDGINGKRAPWSGNPWVWRVAFRRLP